MKLLLKTYFWLTYQADQKTFIDFQTHPDFKLTEYPDGMTIDAYDNIWIALYNGSRIVQVDPVTGTDN